MTASTTDAARFGLPPELFTPIPQCWVCCGSDLVPCNEERLDLANLIADPNLAGPLRDYHGHQFSVKKCVACGFIQPEAIPARPDYFDSIYNLDWAGGWMEAEFTSGYKDTIFRTVLGRLAWRLDGPSGRRLLDVGTHVGRMLDLARQAGWQAEGIELNPKTAAFAAARTNVPVHRKNASELAATGVRYDAVVLTDVLEHIPDPVPILRDIRSLLSPGGWIAVKVPCGKNQLLKQRVRHSLSTRHDPGIATNFVHVNHFGPHSLALALRNAGFDSVRVGVGAPELPPGGRVKGAIARAFRRAVYAAARLPFGVRTPLAMNLQAYARNPSA